MARNKEFIHKYVYASVKKASPASRDPLLSGVHSLAIVTVLGKK